MLTTKAGDVELRIPKLRKGSFLPVILEPRRRGSTAAAAFRTAFAQPDADAVVTAWGRGS
ncbi:hypothetical protein GCM10022237_24160 [Nocardioides ginsengisoli]|uniref:Transposase-like protein n=1 Tax=Nocardioides kongjuensis TaxID=349522 RepID=A0A852RAM3_9ACTN|nr:transposase-like protein [Nocardioides kongjuensis]